MNDTSHASCKMILRSFEIPVEIGLQIIGNRWGHPMKQRGSPSTFIEADFLMRFLGLIMSLTPFTPLSYSNGVLWYALMSGFAYAAFSAILLHAIGNQLAATKYALLSSITNIAVVYMIAFDGWFHDKYGVKAMLWGETLLGIGFVVVSLVALSWFKIVERPIVNKDLIETN